MTTDIFDPYHKPQEPGQIIPQDTVEEFWQEYSEEYSDKTLRSAIELADEAWFQALEEQIEENPDTRARTAYRTSDNFLPNSEKQGELTVAFIDELDLGIEDASKLAASLMKKYNEEENATIEVLGEKYRL